MNRVEVIKILDLLTHAKRIEPLTIAPDMINKKRTLDLKEKIKALRESKSVPAEYLDLFDYIKEENLKSDLASGLLQLLSYISSTNKSEIVLNKFKSGKIRTFDEKSNALSLLLKESGELLKYLKSAKEVEDNLKDESRKVSRNNTFKKILTLEEREEKIADAVNLRLSNFFQLLKETKAAVASMGIK